MLSFNIKFFVLINTHKKKKKKKKKTRKALTFERCRKFYLKFVVEPIQLPSVIYVDLFTVTKSKSETKYGKKMSIYESRSYCNLCN